MCSVMRTDALVFDTEVTTIIGTGSIDLGRETLDLTLNPKTKSTSPVALRSPIYIRGSLAKPVVEVDKGKVAMRGLGVTCLCPSFFPTNIVKNGSGVVDERKSKFAQKLMDRSKWSADDIARIALDAVESDTFYVLPHTEARWIWRLKRVSPWLYAKAIDAMGKRSLMGA